MEKELLRKLKEKNNEYNFEFAINNDKLLIYVPSIYDTVLIYMYRENDDMIYFTCSYQMNYIKDKKEKLALLEFFHIFGLHYLKKKKKKVLCCTDFGIEFVKKFDYTAYPKAKSFTKVYLDLHGNHVFYESPRDYLKRKVIALNEVYSYLHERKKEKKDISFCAEGGKCIVHFAMSQFEIEVKIDDEMNIIFECKEDSSDHWEQKCAITMEQKCANINEIGNTFENMLQNLYNQKELSNIFSTKWKIRFTEIISEKISNRGENISKILDVICKNHTVEQIYANSERKHFKQTSFRTIVADQPTITHFMDTLVVAKYIPDHTVDVFLINDKEEAYKLYQSHMQDFIKYSTDKGIDKINKIIEKNENLKS